MLGQSLVDAAAATAALVATRTLVILDNLEALAPEPHRTLLDAALAWSEARGSRVLYTTRRPDFDHAAYRVENTFVPRRIPLTGLGHTTAPDDPLELEDSMIVATIVQGLADPSTLSDLMPHEAAAEDEPDE